MPLDATGQRRSTFTVLPPTPPEGGGGPQHIRIEIVDRRAQPAPRRYRFGTSALHSAREKNFRLRSRPKT